MRRFLLGFPITGLALVALALLAPRSWSAWWAFAEPSAAYLLAMLVGLPALVAWIAADVFCTLRPRRVFRGRRRATLRIVTLGALAALLAFTIGGVALVFLDRFVPDAAIIGGATALATLGVLAALPRLRPGRCVYCNYDLRAVPVGAMRCPECGVVGE